MTELEIKKFAFQEFFCPEYEQWDLETKIKHLERRAQLFVQRRIKQQRLEEIQRCILRSLQQELHVALQREQEQNHKLKQLSEELAQANEHLERKVLERTKELETKNVTLKTQLEQLREADITLDLLLQKNDHDRRKLIQHLAAQWRDEVLDDLRAVREQSKHRPTRMRIDQVLAKVQAAFPHLENQDHAWCTCLSVREATVARLLAQGKSCRQVAAELDIAARSVNSHCYSIRKKLNVPGHIRLKDYLRKARSTPVRSVLGPSQSTADENAGAMG
ncbi:MAG: hypothetical protein EA399_16485 [Desulfovibrionales bacterium]|nr:MAG: hypothetical protein EA399_16485 [Desulfovibrionales bacterium]